MENAKKELLSLLFKLESLGLKEREYVKGWLDAKLDKKEEVS